MIEQQARARLAAVIDAMDAEGVSSRPPWLRTVQPAVLAAALGLAGCSKDRPPQDDPPEQPSARPVASTAEPAPTAVTAYGVPIEPGATPEYMAVEPAPFDAGVGRGRDAAP